MKAFLKSIFVKEGRLHPLLRSIFYLVAYVLVTVAAQTAFLTAYIIYRVASGESPQIMQGVSPMSFLLDNPFLLLLIEAIGLAALLALTYAFRRYIDRESFVSLGFVRRKGWLAEIGWGVALGFVLMALIFAVEWGGGLLEVQGFAWEVKPLGTISGLLGQYLLFSIMVAVSEEMVFRGYLLANLRQWRGDVLAILLSSILFGVFHGLNPHATPLALAQLVLAGVVFSLAFLVTGNLWLPMAFHFSWNFFEGPIFSFPVSGLELGGLLRLKVSETAPLITGGPFGPEAGLVGLGALSLTILLFVYARKAREAYD